MSDECDATLSGIVNKQNFRYWRTENLGNRQTGETLRSVLKVPIWLAIGWYGIIGSNVFVCYQLSNVVEVISSMWSRRKELNLAKLYKTTSK